MQSRGSIGWANATFNSSDENGANSSPSPKTKLDSINLVESSSEMTKAASNAISNQVVEVDAETNNIADDVFTTDQTNL